MEQKKNFYIFLDIDGVLWDWDFRLAGINNGTIKRVHYIADLNPKSIKAMNYLLKTLNKTHNPKIVLSATMRSNMKLAQEILSSNGLEYNDELLATKLSFQPSKRGREILEFLNTHEKGDFLILDDESYDFKEHFSSDKIIKTSLNNESLTKKHVTNWLKTFEANLNQEAEKGN